MNTTRRGFLGAMLAAAAAPAFVKASNLMPIVAPKQEIILPTLDLHLPGGALQAGIYTASMYVKTPDGVWEHLSRTFKVGDNARTVKLQLPSKDPMVWGLQLEAKRGLQIGQQPPEASIVVSDGGIRMDPIQTPYMPGERIGMSRHTVEDLR